MRFHEARTFAVVSPVRPHMKVQQNAEAALSSGSFYHGLACEARCRTGPRAMSDRLLFSLQGHKVHPGNSTCSVDQHWDTVRLLTASEPFHKASAIWGSSR